MSIDFFLYTTFVEFNQANSIIKTAPNCKIFILCKEGKTLICQNQFTAYVVLAVKRKRQAYIKKKIRDKENQAKREEEQSNFGAEENTVWDRLEVQNEELVAAVQQLKPKARFIVTGYVLKGKTFKELAQETKLTERAAAFTYYRSIEKLRIKMEKEK